MGGYRIRRRLDRLRAASLGDTAMGSRAGTVAMVAWLLAHWKAVVLGAVILILAFGGVRWCRKPPPPPLPPVSETTAPARAKVDAKADAQQRAQAVKQAQKIIALEEKAAKDRLEAAAKADKPLQDAIKAGPDGLSKLATAWWQPGSLKAMIAAQVPKGEMK